jgi:hypothetical protein
MLKPDKNNIQVRYGIGLKTKYFKSVVNIPFPPENKKVKDAFLMKKEVLLKWKDILVSLPEKNDIAEISLCLSPLIITEKPIGCFLLSKEKITENDLQKVTSIRNFVNLISTTKQ